MALKAALVNNPPGGREGRFLREVGRSRPAPQGICVANPAGKVLAWALSFDGPKSIPKFLDHAVERFRSFPDARLPVPAERYARFPSRALPVVADTRSRLPADDPHGAAEYCPAAPPKMRGTVVARVWGRAVRDDGRLAGDCHRQERYIEDVFDVPPAMQAELARAVAGGGTVPVPDRLARHIVTFAYLGQLDVRPVASPVPGAREEVRELEFQASSDRVGDDGTRRLRITGRSDVSSRSTGRRGDGATWSHDVLLDWHGFVWIRGGRIIDLVLSAEGREKLRWGSQALPAPDGADAVARLPAGRPLRVDTAVRYGIVGAPVPDDEAWDGDGPPPSGAGAGTAGGASAARRSAGRKLREVQREVERLVRRGRASEAVRVLERTLEELRKETRPVGGARSK